MDITELINLIANVGFPAAITAYLLIRLEKNITSLTSSINRLNTIISAKQTGLGCNIFSSRLKIKIQGTNALLLHLSLEFL